MKAIPTYKQSEGPIPLDLYLCPSRSRSHSHSTPQKLLKPYFHLETRRRHLGNVTRWEIDNIHIHHQTRQTAIKNTPEEDSEEGGMRIKLLMCLYICTYDALSLGAVAYRTCCTYIPKFTSSIEHYYESVLLQDGL